jgi:hypothetical protein
MQKLFLIAASMTLFLSKAHSAPDFSPIHLKTKKGGNGVFVWRFFVFLVDNGLLLYVFHKIWVFSIG